MYPGGRGAVRRSAHLLSVSPGAPGLASSGDVPLLFDPLLVCLFAWTLYPRAGPYALEFCVLDFLFDPPGNFALLLVDPPGLSVFLRDMYSNGQPKGGRRSPSIGAPFSVVRTVSCVPPLLSRDPQC